MSVQDSLPQGVPIRILKDADTLASEVKSSQARGSGSIVNYRIKSNASYDIRTAGNYTVEYFEVEFIPDNMQFGGSLCYRLEVFPVGLSGSVYTYYRRIAGSSNRQRWHVRTNDSAITSYKLYFFAQGPGTFTVKKL